MITPLDKVLLDRLDNNGTLALYGVDHRAVANGPWDSPLFVVGGLAQGCPVPKGLYGGAARRAMNRPWGTPTSTETPASEQ